MFPFGLDSRIMDGPRMNRKAEEWSSNCLVMVCSGHQALQVLLNGLESGHEVSVPELSNAEKLRLPSLPEEPALSEVAGMYTTYCQNLAQHLSDVTNGPVRLPLPSLFDMISRCLRVSYKDTISIPSQRELASLLPKMYCATLDVLYRLIVCARRNLLPRSKLIIDLYLQTLASTAQMDDHDKSLIRARSYQGLSLWLQVAGPGRYVHSLLKALVLELTTDIRPQDTPFTTVINGTTPGLSRTGGEQERPRGKGKRKKKNKVESYSDLPSMDTRDGSAQQSTCHTIEIEVVQGALEVSEIFLLRGQCLQMQNLAQCILDTTASLQRNGCPRPSPYSVAKCRERLYCTLFACAVIPLESGASNSDTVIHYQLTNQAVSLLQQGADIDEDFMVQTMCKQLLHMLPSSRNAHRPIVRKVLPSDDVGIADIMEMQRETGRLTEENEDLRRRLLKSEMENQSQASELAAMRQQIEILRASQEQKTTTSISEDGPAPRLKSGSTPVAREALDTSSTEVRLGDDCEDSEASGPQDSPHMDRATSAGGVLASLRPDGDDLRMEESRQKMEGQFCGSGRIEKCPSKSDQENRWSGFSADTSTTTTKRRLSSLKQEEETKKGEKRSKMEEENTDKESLEVNAMLLDFVDQEPDCG